MDKTGYNLPIPDLSFTEEEQALLLSRLWELLGRQAARYTAGDSTSLSMERAQQILESLLYTIQVTLDRGTDKKQLLEGNLDETIERGRRILSRRKKEAQVEYLLLCRDLPEARNVYFTDTLRNLKLFFRRYEPLYAAHEIPCSIDYWPLIPMTEQFKGVDYVREYLHRLQLESDFLCGFPSTAVRRLYRGIFSHYSQDFFNLCEPVLTNAIGLELLCADITGLDITAADRESLFSRLCSCSLSELQELFAESTRRICTRLGLVDEAEQTYFVLASDGPARRLAKAIPSGDLSGLFPSLASDPIPV